MRRLLVLALVCLVALAVVGCTDAPTSQSTEQAAPPAASSPAPAAAPAAPQPAPKPAPAPAPAPDPAAVAPPQSTPVAVTVYITDTGKKYHVAGCPSLKKSSHAISLSDAKAQGYTACSKCNPPQ